MRILITGIAGAVGSYMAEHIVTCYPEAAISGIVRSLFGRDTCIERLDAIGRGARDRVQLVVWDMSVKTFASEHIAKIKPDLVFHFASWADVRMSFDQPSKFLQNNIISTVNLFEAIRYCQLEPTIVLASTSEVYGKILDPSEVPIKETNQLRPANPYAVSKATQDLLGWMYFNSYGMKIIRTRAFGYINPRREDLAATTFAAQIAQVEAGERKAVLTGNLDSVRTFLDVRDIVRAYWEAAEKCKPGEAYNIGSPISVSIGNILSMLKSMSPKKIPVRQDKTRMRPADITYQIPDISKFIEATGWRAEYPLYESLQWLLDSARRAA